MTQRRVPLLDPTTKQIARTAMEVTLRERTHSNNQKTERALRHLHVALTRADTNAVDILCGPSDSLGEGAYASFRDEMMHAVLRDKLRAAFQPEGVQGGPGYFGTGGGLTYLAYPQVTGATGTVTGTNLVGLGLKAYVISAGSSVVMLIKDATHYQVIYSKQVASGSFNTYCSVGGIPTATVNTTGAVSRGNRSPLYATNMTDPDYLVITNNGANDITIEGVMLYNGDDPTVNKGVRVWEGAHSGWTAQTFDTNTEWVESLSALPNLRGVVMGIGSNDWYAGYTAAATKTRIQSLITRMRTKVGHSNFSIIIPVYYSREMLASSSIEPWSKFEDMYREIAAADPNVCLFWLKDIFGPQTSSTDDLNGLLYTDYLHPSSAGFLRYGNELANFIMPKGSIREGLNYKNPASLPVSKLQLAAIKEAAVNGMAVVDLGTFGGGAASFATVTSGSYKSTIAGAVTVVASGMPPVTAGRQSTVYWKVVQDATGGRTVTIGTDIFPAKGQDRLNPVPRGANSIAILKFTYDGTYWWWESTFYPEGSKLLTIPNATGALSFGAYALQNWNLTPLAGNVTLAASGGMPTLQDTSAEFYVRYTQDATGSRTLTHTGFNASGAPLPVLKTAAGSIDVLRYYFDGVGWNVESVAPTAAQTKTALALDQVTNTSATTERAAAVTLTNKRINPRVGTGTTTATLTINSDSYDGWAQTAQAGALTIAALTGTPVIGQRFFLRIKDNGVAATITWNAIFRPLGAVLPTTTVASKTMYVEMIYNTTDTKWDVINVRQEA